MSGFQWDRKKTSLANSKAKVVELVISSDVFCHRSLSFFMFRSAENDMRILSRIRYTRVKKSGKNEKKGGKDLNYCIMSTLPTTKSKVICVFENKILYPPFHKNPSKENRVSKLLIAMALHFLSLPIYA